MPVDVQTVQKMALAVRERVKRVVMGQEKSVTIDGVSHKLSPGFMVVATQNPIEQEGTYPLPEAQLDRFLFKLIVPFPERASELEMIKVHGNRGAYASLEQMGITPVC